MPARRIDDAVTFEGSTPMAKTLVSSKAPLLDDADDEDQLAVPCDLVGLGAHDVVPSDPAYGARDGVHCDPDGQGADALVDWLQVVTRIYEDHNPTRLPSIPGYMAKNVGKERGLYERICRVYELDTFSSAVLLLNFPLLDWEAGHGGGP